MPLAVREEDDWEGVPSGTHRDAKVEVDGTAWSGKDDGAEGDYRF